MDLFYRETGSGRPVIIMHGLFGTSDNWQIFARKMGEDFHIFTVDLRNHGQSFHSDDFGYGWMATDLEKFIDDHMTEKPVVIGHSMGGKVAMRAALLFPEKIEKIISIDMGPKYYPVRHHRIIAALQGADILNAGNRKEIEAQLETDIPEWGERQFLMKNLKRRSEGGFEWKMNLSVISDKISHLGETIHGGDFIDLPALFIRGSRSDYILDEDWPEIETHFRNSDLITIEDAGHWVHVDQPEALMRAFYEFI